MRDYLTESQEVLKSPQSLHELLREDKLALLDMLVRFLDDRDIYKRKYAAFCLGQIGDDAIIPPLQAAFGREPEGGGRDAMGAAIATLKKLPASGGSSDEQRREYLEETYTKGVPEWVRDGSLFSDTVSESAAAEITKQSLEIYDAITAIKDYKGEPLSILEYAPGMEANAKRYNLTLVGTYIANDRTVVEKVRDIAARGDVVHVANSGTQWLVFAKAEPQGQAAQKSDSACFIATAACGNPFTGEVMELSAFRDQVLATSRVGRWFIAAYYWLSPPVAKWIATSSGRRRIARRVFILPIVGAIRWFWQR